MTIWYDRQPYIPVDIHRTDQFVKTDELGFGHAKRRQRNFEVIDGTSTFRCVGFFLAIILDRPEAIAWADYIRAFLQGRFHRHVGQHQGSIERVY